MQVFKNMSDVIQANIAHGFYFFNKDTMKHFGSKVESPLMKGRYFVTSETLGCKEGKRNFALRQVQEDYRIKTVDRFDSLEAATEAVENLS